ncbi:MAG TPA: choice-of-anchor D domain-containing protein [Terracidiphilus sp.]|nr:choice-of-anchor D domain-containing protein [Terracidiphilus sp.]
MAGEPAPLKRAVALIAWALAAAVVLPVAAATAQQANAGGQANSGVQRADLPPQVAEAERFMAERGWRPGHSLAFRGVGARRANWPMAMNGIAANGIEAGSAATATWQPLGPTAVETPGFGLVTGRVSALALDPSDLTGNRLYLGTTGGGVWVAQNAATSNPSSVVFTPLTDSLGALGGAVDASISIGALTVQPGGTGVVLAGTGDPNDVRDSYYGSGILRSTDGGNSWSLIARTSDWEQGLGITDYTFAGEGFAGFAWSTVNPQLVVAAVSKAYEGTLVNADLAGKSYEGLYYSPDSGATWHLATITDGGGNIVEGPLATFASPDGNAATSVAWNPVRKLFVAAVRFHGYYQSSDGMTWTRMSAQPGAGLTVAACPHNAGSIGSIACPIFRATLAVNPSSGDTFAWTVDANDQDQGLWQDQCNLSSGVCASQSISFAKQWSTASLETNTPQGAATIANGSYTLALAAVPAGLGAGQDTLLMAGANDLWKCSLAMGCVWRNTTNATTCLSAQVGEFQHVLAWNAANPLEMFVGNDSGLWRSMDAIGESGQACSPADASHFQDLNRNLGSLAEVVSLAGNTNSPYTLMAGLGVNGTAGVKSSTTFSDWPQILGGYGGPVGIDPVTSSNWYVNTGAGVSIYRCTQQANCTAVDFGTTPVVSDADVSGDGAAMSTPAPFLVDPLDSTQLLVGTCRVWRGAADGSNWSTTNAVSPILDTGITTGACSGDAVIRSMAAMALPTGGERVYVGMYGSATGGANLAGHVLSATVNPSSSGLPAWQDLTLNPVVNNRAALNAYGLDISSISIDPHDATGNTAYVTVEGVQNISENIRTVYRTTDGGAHWTDLTTNLPQIPVSSIAVDPQNANTVYVATDQGVYFTTQAASCVQTQGACWSVFGTGLPAAPAVALSASPLGATSQVLVAATYGRGIWQTALWTAGTNLTTAAPSPASITFGSQVFGATSIAQTITLQNTGSQALAVTGIAMSRDFSETDTCANASVAAGSSCAIQVTFTPSATGSREGAMTIGANVYGGQLTVDMTGTGAPAGVVSMTPSSISFGQVLVGSTSPALQVQVGNNSGTGIPISSVAITAPFTIASNSCGTTTLAANTSCQVLVEFAPTQSGAVAGTLLFTDGAGTQTVALGGTGAAPATDTLNPGALSFPATAVDSLSAPQTILLTNTGDATLTSIDVTVSGAFQMSNNCGGQLIGHAACTISVLFAPTQLGAESGTLTVSDALRTQTAMLNGTGAATPTLSVSPTSLTFATQPAGVPSAPQMVTVTNTSSAAIVNVGFQITGAAAGNYSLPWTTCGATLLSGASCAVQIVFTPPATGAIGAVLTVSSSTFGVAPVSVSLNGGMLGASGLNASPSLLNFSTVGVGQTSSAMTVTLTNNTGNSIGALTFAAVGPFAVAQNTCASGLNAAASCTAAVVFQPTATGLANGTLTISSASLSTPLTMALAGTGFDFAVAVSGSSSLTVAAGQTADYMVTITPASGGQGTFTFACGTLPANALCLFNPATTTVSSGVTGNVTVEISTGKSGSARLENPAGWQALPMLCGLLLLPLMLGRRRKLLLPLVLLLATAGAMTSCTSSGLVTSGGTGKSGSGSGTPAGTYSIPVTVTSTGVSHAATVTLTVD